MTAIELHECCIALREAIKGYEAMFANLQEKEISSVFYDSRWKAHRMDINKRVIDRLELRYWRNLQRLQDMCIVHRSIKATV